MNTKKILIVVPDGTGIKNYLFSQILPYLNQNKTEVLVYHALSDDAILEVENLHGITLNKIKMLPYKETFIQKFFRESICYARLLHNKKMENNDTILNNWRPQKKGIVKQLFYKLVERFGFRLSKDYSKILKCEHSYQKALEKSIGEEKAFLKEFQPDVVFCTHQRAITAIPLFKAAEVLGVKTIGAIYSWDNLVKARLSVRTQDYVVWSNHMKNELLKYYPEISASNIYITGTPQFQLYNRAQIQSKELFFESHGLDLNKFTVCFSGDDVLTSPHDPKYLEHLAENINVSQLDKKVQILFRRCPADTSGRYDEVVNKYKDVIVPVAPKWSNSKENWTQLFPYIEDIDLLANICKHSDLVINVGSTMAHDFAIYDRPAAYINYDAIQDDTWSVDTIYRFQHFRSMPNKDVVFWINSKTDYLSVIEKSMANKGSNAKEWLDVINANDIDSAQVISNLLLN
ncbi:MAG: hypothetical protein BM564_09975 [Bacteroidetes bacterium MedPE-SWsnd-G2]|nr:MAG: hypothetical protein BM564_09975 [Bacteroidetes bacterium MedPE-SWsnd-G2]